MLTIVIPTQEAFNEETNEFEVVSSVTCRFEHSLVSLSKWESNFEKPFLSSNDKSPEELMWYIKAMILNRGFPPEVFDHFTNDHVNKINTYVNERMTATWFSASPTEKTSREVITAEVIYYWMISLSIPFECQHWHLNRLLTLIRVCNDKNAPKKKLSVREIAQRNRALNEQRKSQLGSKG
jgi:hypothetical protein